MSGPLRILFTNHTAAVSGAELSLLRLLQGLRAHPVELAVACPAGPLAELVGRSGVPRFELPPFEASLRLHPLHTPVGLARLGAGGVSAARSARRFGADLLHANTLRAGLSGAVARRLGAPPMVVRAHEHIPLTATGSGVRFVLAHSAAAVVAVSHDVARRLNEGLARPLARAVHNSIDHARFDPERVRPAPVHEALGIDPGAALIGQVAQITPWKGQDVAIQALAQLRRDGLNVHLLLVGEVTFAGAPVRHDNRAFLGRLHDLIERFGVRDAVHLLGQRSDVPELLAALDLTLLPSWNEPFGLATVESMAMATPPVVSSVGAGPELIEDGVTGRLIDPGHAEPWARAIAELLADRGRLVTMGREARSAAARFRDDVQADAMLRVYERVLERRIGEMRAWAA